MDLWQMISDNGSLLRAPTAELRTTEMPNLRRLGIPDVEFGYRFESCMFFGNGNSEVLDRYQSQIEAFEGHRRLCAQHGLTRNHG